ncbi:DUF881 domain-containing protein [Streptomyces hygroscopicus]|uniref:DUF881 domain-containing protein n=1 Tax=Streptomyces hygroscopicus TaxID=1912 RepID=UPI003790272C
MSGQPRRPGTPERSERSGEARERPEPGRPAVAGPPGKPTPSPARGPERRDAPQRPGRPAAPGPGGLKDLVLRTPLPKAVLPEALPPQAQGRSVAAGPPAAGSAATGPHGPRDAGAGGAAADGPLSGPGEPAGPASGSGADQGPEEALTGRQRLVKGVWPPRLTRAQLIVALLLFGLGLGLAIQVRSTNENSVLRGARQEDLVRILDELDSRTQRLQDEKRRLENQRTELENSSDQAEEARKQTLQKEQQLGVLAGTVAAQGPGITITIDDSHGSVESDMLLDTVQELRAAGAEAIQIGDVRVVAGTYFSDSGGAIQVDGRKVTRPYVVKVIGKPEDLEPALNIPGGVVQSLEKEQATVSVRREKKIVVDALRSAKRPDYARSSSR